MSKYAAKKTDCAAGHTHDSKLEAGRCDDLHALQATGNIRGLEMQPEFRVVVGDKPICTYRADFAYFTNAARVVEDVKGVLTPVYRLKKKLVEAAHPGTVITEYPPRIRKKRKRKGS